ncbi:hypothetical protein V8G54_004639 [Vigna mungo]|uniref:Uncharacterized protein n=1 Tax=Vigna mungo TaxID=3915 RepID=A0AAQ3PEN6_VIGMU
MPLFTSANLKGRNSPSCCGSQDPTPSSNTENPLITVPASLLNLASFIVPDTLHERHTPHHCPALYPQLLQTHSTFSFDFFFLPITTPPPPSLPPITLPLSFPFRNSSSKLAFEP